MIGTDFDPYVPPFVCGKCFVAPTCIKNDVSVSVLSRGVYYYTISADLWACPVCNEITLTGFARSPVHCYLDPGEAAPSTDFEIELNPESLMAAKGVLPQFETIFSEIIERFKSSWSAFAKS